MIAEVPPFVTASLAGGRQACVVDARLALASNGLLAVSRLAAQLDVWLPTELAEVLREPGAFRERPGRLVPWSVGGSFRSIDECDAARGVAQELGLWDLVPEIDELAALRLYRLGARADESVTPPLAPVSLRERCEQLAQGLDVLVKAADYDLPRGAVISACFRDALALAVALIGYRSIILTRFEPGARGEQPAMCEYLGEWGITAHAAPRSHANAALRGILSRAGLDPVEWGGAPLAALHVVLPGYPPMGHPPRASVDDLAAAWRGAQVFWVRP